MKYLCVLEYPNGTIDVFERPKVPVRVRVPIFKAVDPTLRPTFEALTMDICDLDEACKIARYRVIR